MVSTSKLYSHKQGR